MLRGDKDVCDVCFCVLCVTIFDVCYFCCEAISLIYYPFFYRVFSRAIELIASITAISVTVSRALVPSSNTIISELSYIARAIPPFFKAINGILFSARIAAIRSNSERYADMRWKDSLC